MCWRPDANQTASTGGVGPTGDAGRGESHGRRKTKGEPRSGDRKGASWSGGSRRAAGGARRRRRRSRHREFKGHRCSEASEEGAGLRRTQRRGRRSKPGIGKAQAEPPRAESRQRTQATAGASPAESGSEATAEGRPKPGASQAEESPRRAGDVDGAAQAAKRTSKAGRGSPPWSESSGTQVSGERLAGRRAELGGREPGRRGSKAGRGEQAGTAQAAQAGRKPKAPSSARRLQAQAEEDCGQRKGSSSTQAAETQARRESGQTPEASRLHGSPHWRAPGDEDKRSAHGQQRTRVPSRGHGEQPTN